MKRIGIIAGESAEVLERVLAGLRAINSDWQAAPPWIVADAAAPALASALQAGAYARQEAIVLAAARALQAEGVDALVLLSWRLHEFADAINATGAAPLILVDTLLSTRLLRDGVRKAGFLAHPEAYLRPEVRYRMESRDEVTLICPNEDVFELLEQGMADQGFATLTDRDRQRFLKYVQQAWKYQHLTAVVCERAEWEMLVRLELGFLNVLTLERVWIDAIGRFLRDEAEPAPPLSAPPTFVPADLAADVVTEVCHRLNCDARSLDFGQDRYGDLVLFVPNLPGAEDLPSVLSGVSIVVSKP